jgi:hypothetical protein
VPAPRQQAGTLLPGATGDPVDGTLGVVEDDESCTVVVDGDEEDWLVRFDKADDFAARDWADNMASVYNRRRGRSSAEARWRTERPA